MNLFEVFEISRKNYPNLICLVVNGKSYTYAEMGDWVDRIAFPLKNSTRPFIGIYAYRCFSAYAGILAILKAGKAYVPLNPKFPAIRNQEIIRSAELDILIVGPNYQAEIPGLTDGLEKLLLIYPENRRSEINLRNHNSSKIYADNLSQSIGNSIAPSRDGFA